jgi:hypothetical protein
MRAAIHVAVKLYIDHLFLCGHYILLNLLLPFPIRFRFFITGRAIGIPVKIIRRQSTSWWTLRMHVMFEIRYFRSFDLLLRSFGPRHGDTTDPILVSVEDTNG